MDHTEHGPEFQSVTVSNRHQISLQNAVRSALSIQAGDRLLVRAQDGVILLLPLRDSVVDELDGLGADIWHVLDVDDYIDKERTSWTDSSDSSDAAR